MKMSIRRTFADTALAAAVVGVFWFGVPGTSPETITERLVLGGVSIAAFVMRSVVPRSSFGIVLVVTGIVWVVAEAGDPWLLAAVCLSQVAANTRSTAKFGVLALIFLGLTFMASLVLSDLAGTLVFACLGGAVVLCGAWRLSRERGRAREALVVVAQQRVRGELERDVHDVLTHSLGMIGVRAGVSAHTHRTAPHEILEVLHEIEADARAGIGEIGHVLRNRSVSVSVRSEPVAHELIRQVARLNQAGVHTTLTTTGEVDNVTQTVGTVVIRIVQECLTNVVRHAQANRCAVRVTVAGSRIEIVVEDDGQAATPELRPGRGLRGMSDRVAIAGGEISFHQTAHGFRIHAWIPR